MVAGLTEAVAERHEIVAFAPSGLRRRHAIVDALAGLPVESKLVTLPAARAWRAAWSRSGLLSVERIVGPLDVFHFSDWMYPPQRGGPPRRSTIWCHSGFPARPPAHPSNARCQVQKRGRHLRRHLRQLALHRRRRRQPARFPAERIHVAYPGIDPRFRPEGTRAEFEHPYVLAVSTLEPRKNLGTLIDAFERLRGRRDELLLVVAGGLAPGVDAPGVPEGVRLLGYVEDDELAALYRGALAFVYPSMFEGFGLPVVEALASGTPTVASTHPSLDEAAGAATMRADPNDPDALAEAIEIALAGNDERRAAGFTHAARSARAATRCCAYEPPSETGVRRSPRHEPAHPPAPERRCVQALEQGLDGDPDVELQRLSFGARGRAAVLARDLGWYLGSLPNQARREGASVLHCPTFRARSARESRSSSPFTTSPSCDTRGCSTRTRAYSRAFLPGRAASARSPSPIHRPELVDLLGVGGRSSDLERCRRSLHDDRRGLRQRLRARGFNTRAEENLGRLVEGFRRADLNDYELRVVGARLGAPPGSYRALM